MSTTTRLVFCACAAWLLAAVVPSLASPAVAQNLLINPSGELSVPGNGWTAVGAEDWRMRTSSPAPHHGTYYFYPGVVASAELYQDVDVSADAAAIDSGDRSYRFSGWLAGYNGSDMTRFIVEYRDAAATVLGSFVAGERSSTKTWIRVTDLRQAPVGTRTIRVRMICTRYNGTNNNAYVDDLSLTVESPPTQTGLLANGDGERGMDADGRPLGWTHVTGDWALRTSIASPGPAEGDFFFHPGDHSTEHSAELSQDVDVGAYASAIDAGTLDAHVGASVRTYDGTDSSEIIVDALDASLDRLGSFATERFRASSSWVHFGRSWRIPAGTRTLRVRLMARKDLVIGSWNNGYFDSVDLSLSTAASPLDLVSIDAPSTLPTTGPGGSVIARVANHDLAARDAYLRVVGPQNQTWSVLETAIPAGSTVDIAIPLNLSGGTADTHEVFQVILDDAAFTSTCASECRGWSARILPPDAAGMKIVGILPQPLQNVSGQAGEVIILANEGPTTVDLTQLSLSDFDAGGQATARSTFPPGSTVGPGELVWISPDAPTFVESWGFAPDFELDDLIGDASLLLTNGGDELVLFHGTGSSELVVDAVLYKSGGGDEGLPFVANHWSGGGIWAYESLQLDTLPVTSGTLHARRFENGRFLDTDRVHDWTSETKTQDHPIVTRRTFRQGWLLDEYLAGPLTLSDVAGVEVVLAPDNSFEALQSLLSRATQSVRIKNYIFSSREIADLLIELMERPIDRPSLSILTDWTNWKTSRENELHIASLLHEAASGTATKSAGSGIQMDYHYVGDPTDRGRRYHLMHEKTIIVDDRWVMVGSGNFTSTSYPPDDKTDGETRSNRDVWIIVDSPTLASYMAGLFDADIAAWDVFTYPNGPLGAWQSGMLQSSYATLSNFTGYSVAFPTPFVPTVDPHPMDLEVVVSPENVLTPGRGILGLVESAGEGDEILVWENLLNEWRGSGSIERADGDFQNNTRLMSLVEAARRGATVRILFDGLESGSPDADQFLDRLASEGLDLVSKVSCSGMRRIHNKMLLVKTGGRHVSVFGSLNGHEKAYKQTREISLLVDSAEIHGYLSTVFDHDWQAPASCI